MPLFRNRARRREDREHTYRTVCLVQLGDRHTELLGFFLAHFANAQIDLVYRDASDYSYVSYFQRSLGIRFRRVLADYDRRERYDLVVFLTSGEARIFRVTLRKRMKRLLEAIGLEPLAMKIWFAFKHRGRGRSSAASPAQTASANDVAESVELARTQYRTPLLKNSRQTIALCHIKPHATNECPNLALSPLLHPLPWLLPVFTGLPTTRADERPPTICCMGLLEERYYQIIPALARALPDHELRFFARQAHPTCMALLSGLTNVVVSVGESTDSMMAYLATSRYLLILDHPESRYRKDRLSGAMPFGVNLAVPMVMSRQLAALNDIRSGVVTYDDTPGDDLVARMAAITPDAYRVLVDEALAERARLARVAAQRFDAFLRAGDASESAPALARARA